MPKFIRSGKLKYTDGYKYQIDSDFHIDISNYLTGKILKHKFFELNEKGLLSIKDGYAWDGASGPTIDTDSSMVGALVHDVLYQAMRLQLLDGKYRQKADELLCDICKEDGMFSWRASLWYNAVRKGAGYAANPKNDKKVHEAP